MDLTAVFGCQGDPIWLRLWGFGVTPYGSGYGVLGCPYMCLTVCRGVGVTLTPKHRSQIHMGSPQNPIAGAIRGHPKTP